MQRSVVIPVAVAALVFAEAASAQTAGYRVVRRPRLPFVITGAVMFASGYILGAAAAVVAGFGGLAPAVLVPVVGPFIGLGWDLANPQGCPLDYNIAGCKGTNVDPSLAFAGGLQVVGATLFAVGMVRHDAKAKATVTPGFAWVSGPRFSLTVRF